MTTELTIITPGGLAMASEEVFAHIAQCQKMSSVLDSGAWRLAMLGQAESTLGQAVAALRHAKDRVEKVAAALSQLAERAAEQESWRQRHLVALRDRLLFAVVAGSAWSAAGFGSEWVESGMAGNSHDPTPKSSLRGGRDSAVHDDIAAILAGSAGDLSEVSVWRVGSPAPATPAQSMAERISRIPDTDTPIRVETYRLPDGAVHADVFIAGTHEWGMGVGESAFDMESNLKLVAGQTALSAVATTHALRLAGVKPGDSVTFVGHSQGGAVAGTLAESGVYRTAGLVTVGSPTGTIPIQGDYPALVIEHSNDIVPRLGGERLTTEATIVTRDSGHSRLDVVGAHSSETYRQTAGLIDQSAAPELSRWLGPIPAGSSGQVSLFSASRLTDQ